MIAFIISTGVANPEDPVGRGGQVLTPRKAQEASGELPSPPLRVLPQTERTVRGSSMQDAGDDLELAPSRFVCLGS